jgi:hypothetical protein
MAGTRKFDERLVIVLPTHQKAEIVALANREEMSIGALVRRALKREVRSGAAA